MNWDSNNLLTFVHILVFVPYIFIGVNVIDVFTL